MSKKFSKKPLALALGAAFALTGAAAQASVFHAADLGAGYMVAAAGEEKGKEGKCGEGKCGEGKCGGDKKAKHEGKCGEGKCGGDKKAKHAEGKCGEGKCGEGKCGGDKKGATPATRPKK